MELNRRDIPRRCAAGTADAAAIIGPGNQGHTSVVRRSSAQIESLVAGGEARAGSRVRNGHGRRCAVVGDHAGVT